MQVPLGVILKKLVEVTGLQALLGTDQRPADRFLDLLSSAFGAGKAHLRTTAGNEPPDANAWGWYNSTTTTETEDGEVVEKTFDHRLAVDSAPA